MDTTETVAWIGAITGSIGTITGISALLWDLYKWKRSGPELKITATPGMAMVNVLGIGPNERFISVTVTNSGHSETTITQFMFAYFESEPNKRLNKPSPKQILVVGPQGFGDYQGIGEQLPHVLEPGRQWNGLARQSEEIERMGRTGHLYALIYHSLGEGKPVFARVMMETEALTSK